MNRCTACAVAGLAVCAHLTVGVIEAAHPHHQSEARAVDALPADDHDHREFNATVRIEDANLTSGTSSAAPPPGGFILDSARIARRNFERWRRPSVLIFPPAPDADTPPGRFVQ